ncbi:uncharacterized protein F5Z01DRAFT_635085 [Emericellopsis atlantica]|uniref:Uncharacterized protein n=1 Tax=Emericellopsis atlantica TaxID=2614577 RepID=A0A9P7ZQT2_9HYPO|nr:uncharacterized protein F5Z01DRAFT_635085 [Emericellopsis atlantica]KAG9256132.1 hypothetical protein F5Z01DRAFT_635085 [Emericellopsis atlantica]
MSAAPSLEDTPPVSTSPSLVATTSPARTPAAGPPSASSPDPATALPAASTLPPVTAPFSPPPSVVATSAQSLAALATHHHQQHHEKQHHQQQPHQRHAEPPTILPRPGELSPTRHVTPAPTTVHAGPASVHTPPAPYYVQATSPPPPRQTTSSSASTQATSATIGSAETNNTSYSADTSPTLHQSIFSLKDGSDVSNNRRTSRRRTGPLSQQSREKAALIRKLGACKDCRRRRVACQPAHYNLTWDDLYRRFNRSSSPNVQDIAPSTSGERPQSPLQAHEGAVPAMFAHEPQEMDIDTPPHASTSMGRSPLSDARNRTPLPSGPRLEKSLSLPRIENLKNELQSHAARMLSTASRSRYTSVHALLLHWQDDDNAAAVGGAVRNLAHVLEYSYRYSVKVKPIPSSSDGSRNAWRWLSRELNEFCEQNDQRDVLKIVYYAGHTYLEGETVLSSSKKDLANATTVRWNGLQQILEVASADTLVVMDAAYFPSSKLDRRTGVLELIAAAMSEDHHEALDTTAFTVALTELLRVRAGKESPLTAAEAHSILFSSYSRMVRDRVPEQEVVTRFPAPLHIMASGNPRLPSIYLVPTEQSSLSRSTVHDDCPLLHMSVRLADDNVDLDAWNEWLRLMPDSVRDVKVEGPYRSHR